MSTAALEPTCLKILFAIRPCILTTKIATLKMRINPQAIAYLVCQKSSSGIFSIHKLFGNFLFSNNIYVVSSLAEGGGSRSPQQKKRRGNPADVDATRKQMEEMASPSNGTTNDNTSDDDASKGDGGSNTADAPKKGDDDSIDNATTFRPDMLHNTNNPLRWGNGDFTHTAESIEAVERILRSVTPTDFTSGKVHPSGLVYTINHDQLQDKDIQLKFMSCIMPAFFRLLESVLDSDEEEGEEDGEGKDEVRGFDINRLTKDEIQNLFTKSTEAFENDYNNNDNSNDGNDDTTKEGSVYLKFIVMSVTEWINACQSLMDGERSGPLLKSFAKDLKEKLEHGLAENWWNENDSYSIPYIGESSAQTFAQRMSNRYPSMFYSFERQEGAEKYELKIATVEYQNSIQSRALESFVATLLSKGTELTRGKKSSCLRYISCLCLRSDNSAFNDVICGDRIHYRRGGRGHDISNWFHKYCNLLRNDLIMKCIQRNVAVLHFVIEREFAICKYINDNPRDKAKSRKVRENTGGPQEPRKDRNDITVEDAARYFGWLVGSTFVDKEIGVQDPEWKLERLNEELEDMYQQVLGAYQDSTNFVNGTFFPSAMNHKTMITCFKKIRDEENETYNIKTREYRRSFWLSKDLDIEHLLYKEKFDEADRQKWLFKHHGSEAGFWGNLETSPQAQEGEDNDDVESSGSGGAQEEEDNDNVESSGSGGGEDYYSKYGPDFFGL